MLPDVAGCRWKYDTVKIGDWKRESKIAEEPIIYSSGVHDSQGFKWEKGDTALHMALRNQKTAVAGFLICYGATVMIRNDQDRTAVDVGGASMISTARKAEEVRKAHVARKAAKGKLGKYVKTGSNIGQVKGDGNILKEIEVQWTDDSTVSIDFKKLEKATKDEWVAAAREVAKEKLSQYVKTGSKIGQLKGDGDVLKEVEVQWADDSTAFVEFKTLQTATKDEWERAVREAAKKKLGKYVKTGSIWACSIGQVKGDGNVLKEIEVQWTDDSTVSVDFKRLEKATKDEWVAEVAKPRDSWLEILVASLSVDLSVYGILRVEQLIELADDAKLDEITAKETHCC